MSLMTNSEVIDGNTIRNLNVINDNQIDGQYYRKSQCNK